MKKRLVTKKIKKYYDYLEKTEIDIDKIKNYKTLYEKAFSKEKRDNIKRLIDTNKPAEALKELNKDINQVKELIKTIDYDELKLNKRNKDSVKIKYTIEIESILYRINDIIQDDEFIYNKIIGDGYDDITLEVSLTGKLNRLDIINSLPNYLKGLGLGKKIYKKLIKTFGWVSTIEIYEPSIESSMVWNTLTQDKELYTFANGNNLIIFWNSIDYDIIFKLLRQFYKKHTKIIIDDDFITKYNLDETEFILKLIE